jgi:hypothetical protein
MLDARNNPLRLLQRRNNRSLQCGEAATPRRITAGGSAAGSGSGSGADPHPAGRDAPPSPASGLRFMHDVQQQRSRAADRLRSVPPAGDALTRRCAPPLRQAQGRLSPRKGERDGMLGTGFLLPSPLVGDGPGEGGVRPAGLTPEIWIDRSPRAGERTPAGGARRRQLAAGGPRRERSETGVRRAGRTGRRGRPRQRLRGARGAIRSPNRTQARVPAWRASARKARPSPPGTGRPHGSLVLEVVRRGRGSRGRGSRCRRGRPGRGSSRASPPTRQGRYPAGDRPPPRRG